MASRPSLVTPSVRFEMQRSGSFPLAKIPRIESPETPSFNEKVSIANGTVDKQSTWTCTQNKYLCPQRVQRGCQSLRPCSLQRVKTQVVMVMDSAAESVGGNCPPRTPMGPEPLCLSGKRAEGARRADRSEHTGSLPRFGPRWTRKTLLLLSLY